MPKTINEFVTLQVKIKNIFKNNFHKGFKLFVLSETKTSKTNGKESTSGWKSKIEVLKITGYINKAKKDALSEYLFNLINFEYFSKGKIDDESAIPCKKNKNSDKPVLRRTFRRVESPIRNYRNRFKFNTASLV